MAHLAFSSDPEHLECAEFGVSVLKKARGRGYGSRLFERAVIHARNQGVNLLFIHALSENIAMIRIARRLQDEGRGARLVLQVHDELLLEVPEPEVSKVRDLVRAEMCGAYDLDPALAVDVGVGDNWAEAKS